MTRSDVAFLVAAVALVVCASVLAGIEAALTQVSRIRVEEAVRAGRRGRVSLTRVIADLPRYVNLLLLLRYAASLTATAIVAVLLAQRFGANWRAILIAAAAMTVVEYVVVGVAPRTLGRQHPEVIALATAPLVLFASRVLGPLPRLLILLGNALTPGRGFREGPFTSEAELRELVDLAEQRRVIESGEREMIHSVFELGDTIVREVMVPRTDMVWIERTKTVRQALSLALRSGFSRIPVVGGGADDVVGVAYLKDLARRVYEDADSVRVDEVMRTATFVPDSKPVDELLRAMQAAQSHLAIVVDEYGGTAGLVTIEDVLEEIVGEIADEYDRETPRVERVDNDTVRVSTRLPVDDVEEMYGTAFDLDGVDSVGGLLAHALGRVPIPGATATLQGLAFTAEAGKGRRHRVGSVLIRREQPPPGRPTRTAEDADA
ncbi:MAG TPA: hemolysin family protein [Mycobacteriales bacterium]|nr:hemolysin family protein [Mycobacteriales bacterium]